MDTDSILKMFLFFLGLSALLFYIVILGLPKSQKHKTPTKKLLQDAIRNYLIRQVCIQCDVLENQLDNRALNRIDGAAFKSVKPLLKDQEVCVQLHQLVKKGNKFKDFELSLSFEEIKPFFKNR